MTKLSLQGATATRQSKASKIATASSLAMTKTSLREATATWQPKAGKIDTASDLAMTCSINEHATYNLIYLITIEPVIPSLSCFMPDALSLT